MIYLTNGNMPLNAAYADEIVQEDNSTYQLTFRFLTSDSLWEQLKEETFLTADDLHGEQDFVIFEVEKKHGYIQVYANQVFTLLNNYVVSSLALDRATGSTALSRFAGAITRDNPFSFFSDIEDRHTFNVGFKNAMEAFAKDKHSIIGQWGGDLVRHGYQVRLLKNGGSENESLFMYKKNLSSYQHKTSTKSLKTRITFIATVKGEGEKAPDRTFTVTIDSPLINKYSQIYEDVIEVNDQDVKDEASLRKYGEQYYRTSLCDMMEDSLEIEVVGQSDVPVQMFDVVSIFHERYNLDVRKKITKYTYSPMAKKLKSIGFGQFQSGLANAIGNAVSDAVKGEAQQLQGNFERQLAREIKNADLAFDRRKEELVKQFTDDVNAINAKAEETKQEISDTIDQRFSSFDNGPLQDAKRKAEEALRKAGASSSLAQEAQQIGFDAMARLEAFKDQTYIIQSTLTGDVDVLKRTVNNEVNQASEYRRTTTEALSRMTGQMNGFATKSEVKQGIDGLIQTFAKMKVGGTNLLKGSKGPFLPDRKPANFDNNILYVGNTSIYMEQGQEYIISAKTDGNFTAHHDGTKESDNVVLWIMDKNIRNYQIVSDLKTGTTGTKIIWDKPTGIYHLRVNTYHKEAIKSVWNVKIEKGNIATDWSPAPEDTEGIITEAKATFERTAQGLRTDLSAIQEYVNKDGQRQEALQRYTREESARQATAVREFVSRDFVGKVTHQEDVRGINQRIEEAKKNASNELTTRLANYRQTVDGKFTDISSQVTTYKHVTDEKFGDLSNQIVNNKNSTDGQIENVRNQLAKKVEVTDFQRVQETSKLYERILGNTDNGIANNVARMALTNQLFQVEVTKASASGRNLFLNSLFKRDLRERYSTYDLFDGKDQTQGQLALSIDTNEKFKGASTLKIVSTFNGKQSNQKATFTIGGDARLGTVDEMRNKSVRFSFWAKSTVNNTNFQARAGYRSTVKGISLTTDWQFYDIELIRNENSNATSELILHIFTSATVWIAFPKVEIGTVATPFSEAPEDTDEAIRTAQSQLAGSWAVQNLTSTGSIVSQINATNNQILIEAKKIRLKGKTLLDELTAIQGYFKRLFVGDASVGTLNSDIIRSNSITADKLVMDIAMARRFVSSDIFTDTLAAKEAFINKLRSVVVTATLLEGFQGLIGGFRFGQYTNRNGYFITGTNSVSVGMGNGMNAGANRNAFWANWGESLDTPGPKAWYVNTDGKMYCRNEATFHSKVDFSSISNPNFYSKIKAHKGVWVGTDDVNGEGDNPAGGYNAVVWWSQIVTGKFRQHAGITTGSDRKLKENIEPTPVKALDKINALNLVAFDYIKDKTHEEIGLIAQEVLNIIPSSVEKYEDEDNHLTINYSKFVPYLIKAIQELNQKIEKMEKTIA